VAHLASKMILEKVESIISNTFSAIFVPFGFKNYSLLFKKWNVLSRCGERSKIIVLRFVRPRRKRKISSKETASEGSQWFKLELILFRNYK